MELFGAPVSVLDLEALLSLELCDHVVDGFLHLDKGVQAQRRGERSQSRLLRLRRHGHQHARGTLAARRSSDAPCLHKRHGLQGPAEQVPGVVSAEDRDGLRHRGQLCLPGFLPLLPLLVRCGTRLLELQEELLVRTEGGRCVLAVLLGLRQPLISGCELLLLVPQGGLSHLDLVLLGSLHRLVGPLCLKLLLLRGREVGLKCSLHLLENAEDLSRLRLVRARNSRRRIAVALRSFLQHREDHAPLLWRECALQESHVPLERCTRRTGNGRKGAATEEREAAMVLGQHHDCRIKRPD
mmetsp:Transcript_55342/g.177473  ORF Transcript_55342/g.177473 Transcript_55342/m.177473 type:complete len:297 (+) Transcript_55342:797-1687(+)